MSRKDDYMNENIIYKYRHGLLNENNPIIEDYKRLKDDYIDPDGCIEFYEDFKNSKFGKDNILNRDGKTIQLKIYDEPLKSDVFGFSFNEKNYSNPRYYPYDAYLVSLKEEDLPDGLSKVEKWLNSTRWNIKQDKENRIISGSFFWPKSVIDVINKARGGRCECKNSKKYSFYIQDRVDLTLYAIKEFYEKKDTSILKFNCLKSNKKLKSFLDIFNNFKGYVQFFKFNDFVKEENGTYEVIDIYRSNIEESKIILLKENIDMIVSKGDLRDFSCDKPTSKKDFERLFRNIQLLILERNERLKKRDK